MGDKAEHIAGLAEKALFYEVALTPKPGLVDRQNTGAHQDMDFFTFIDSIVSLRPFLAAYVEAGLQHTGSPRSLFEEVRQLGIAAEQAMLTATKGINTHKGANFSFAVLLGATGYYFKSREMATMTATDSQEILRFAGEMTQHLLATDFAELEQKAQLSYGEKLYLEQGLTGIRGEAGAGYPTLGQILLPFLREWQALSAEELGLRGLVLLMSEVEDGNLLHRGGLAAWQAVKVETKKIHQAGYSFEELLDELTAYDQLLIQRHLSPGGTADLLALGLYFAFLEGLC